MSALVAILLATAAPVTLAQDELRETLFGAAEARLQEARDNNAPLLAPTSFVQARDKLEDALEDFERGRNLDRIRSDLNEAMVLLQQSIDASAIAEVTLASLIKTRDDALNADAPTFAAPLWHEAEQAFTEAAERLEYGNIRQTREAGEEAEVLFRDAELTAIKAQYLSQTRALLAQAEQVRAPRYAPRTFARAQSLYQQAEVALNENRYDTDVPRSLAQQAAYEASHAIYLANQISLIDDEEQTIEDLVLRYEDSLSSIAAAADRVAALDEGTTAITEELILFIEELRDDASQAEVDLADTRVRIAELQEEIRALDEQLGGVSQERVALVQRLEAEARIREQFASIETMFTRDEARVSREGNNLVLRLVGLTFESGESEIPDEHRALLGKVADAANVFQRSQITIEGHTDSYGSDEANLELSRDRADAVRRYIATQFNVPEFRTSAVGYGETQPIANNETAQGRSRNRRIDIRIEPQLE